MLGDATLSAVNVMFVVRTDAATLEAEQSHLGAAAVTLFFIDLTFGVVCHFLYRIFFQWYFIQFYLSRFSRDVNLAV